MKEKTKGLYEYAKTLEEKYGIDKLIEEDIEAELQDIEKYININEEGSGRKLSLEELKLILLEDVHYE